MIDPVSVSPLLSALSRPGAGDRPGVPPDAGQFQAVLMHALGGGLNSGGGLGAGDQERSDPAAELLPLLVQMALMQNPPIQAAASPASVPAVGTGPATGTAPAADASTGGVSAPEDEA